QIPTQHAKPPSFHSSPQEAMQAPPEEFLYLVCLHEGTGVEKPDFLAVVDAEKGDIVHELPMPNVGDELHHFGWDRFSPACPAPAHSPPERPRPNVGAELHPFGWTRCSSACHGPDRSHLVVPGFRSSRFHIINVADDPRKPFIEKVIKPEDVIRD